MPLLAWTLSHKKEYEFVGHAQKIKNEKTNILTASADLFDGSLEKYNLCIIVEKNPNSICSARPFSPFTIEFFSLFFGYFLHANAEIYWYFELLFKLVG